MGTVIEEIRSMQTVTRVDSVQGMYDVIVQLDAPNETIKETIRTRCDTSMVCVLC